MNEAPHFDDAAAFDHLLTSSLSTLLPILPDETALEDVTIPSPIISETILPEAVSETLDPDDDKPVFTALEAELLLASLEESGDKEHEENIQTSDGATGKKQKTKLSSRKRQQQEMEYLRAQVVELENALNRLKEEQIVNDDVHDTSVSEATGALWEQIAKRQMEEKHRAEVENIKLRTLLEGQLRVAHGLEKLLSKRSLAEAEPLVEASKRPRISGLLPSAEVQPSSAQLDTMLDEIDTVMENSRLADVETEIDECHLKTDDQDQIFLERTMSKLLPFPLHQAGDAAWQRLTPLRLDFSNGYYGTTRQSGGDYDIEFSVMTKVRRSLARCTGFGAGRRQRKPGQQEAMVWQIHAELAGQAFTDHSVGMLDCGYLAIKPLTTPNGVTSCILRFCVRIWPQLAASELDKTGLFVDLVLSSFNQNTKTILQMIENDLLEQSLAMPSQ